MNLGEPSYERPPASMLLSTFQRLGVSSAEMSQEAKRLRVSVHHDAHHPSHCDSPVVVDLDPALHSHESPSQSTAPPFAFPGGSPAPSSCDPHDHAQGSHRESMLVQDDGNGVDVTASRRSPSDHERLSPVSQLLLSGRPGLLQRHLASLRQQEAANTSPSSSNGSERFAGSSHHHMQSMPAPGLVHHLAGGAPSSGMPSSRSSPAPSCCGCAEMESACGAIGIAQHGSNMPGASSGSGGGSGGGGGGGGKLGDVSDGVCGAPGVSRHGLSVDVSGAGMYGGAGSNAGGCHSSASSCCGGLPSSGLPSPSLFGVNSLPVLLAGGALPTAACLDGALPQAAADGARGSSCSMDAACGGEGGDAGGIDSEGFRAPVPLTAHHYGSLLSAAEPLHPAARGALTPIPSRRMARRTSPISAREVNFCEDDGEEEEEEVGSGSSARSKRRSAAPHPLQQSHHATTTTRPGCGGSSSSSSHYAPLLSPLAEPMHQQRPVGCAGSGGSGSSRRAAGGGGSHHGASSRSRELLAGFGSPRSSPLQSPSPASAIPGGAALPLMRGGAAAAPTVDVLPKPTSFRVPASVSTLANAHSPRPLPRPCSDGDIAACAAAAAASLASSCGGPPVLLPFQGHISPPVTSTAAVAPSPIRPAQPAHDRAEMDSTPSPSAEAPSSRGPI